MQEVLRMKQRWKRWIAAVMAGLMMCMIGGVMPGNVQMHLGEPIVAEAYNWDLVDDYPQKYKDGALDAIIDEWRYYNRECTSFVAWRLNSRNGVDFYNYYGGVNFGDAGTWGSAARSIGITVDMNPAPGSVFWQQSGKYGHVAWVNTVNDDGTVTIEEYNWLIDNSYYDGAYHSRNVAVSSASGYIHIKDIDPTPKGHIMSEDEAAGQTIPDGDYYIYNALDCHYYMDLPARELESGDNVKMWNDEKNFRVCIMLGLLLIVVMDFIKSSKKKRICVSMLSTEILPRVQMSGYGRMITATSSNGRSKKPKLAIRLLPEQMHGVLM